MIYKAGELPSFQFYQGNLNNPLKGTLKAPDLADEISVVPVTGAPSSKTRLFRVCKGLEFVVSK